MKHIILMVLCTITPIVTVHAKRESKPNRPENAQVVISNLAQLIGQVGNIIEKPHDADAVGNSVSNMVNNIIKITVNAVQNKSISIDQAYNVFDQLFELCKDLDDSIIYTITTKRSILIGN